MQQSQKTVQTSNAASMTGQRRRLWVNIETALVDSHVFAYTTVYKYEPEFGGYAYILCTRYIVEWMLASTGDGGGRNTRRRYIWTCLIGSFLNYILDI